jgi:NitT/TauT family transport system substrate-binding protein
MTVLRFPHTLAALVCILLAACGGAAAPASSTAAAPSAAAASASAAAKPSVSSAAAAFSSAKPATSGGAAASAAAKPAASGAASQAGGLLSVKISNPSPAASVLPFYVALSQGFFKDERLDVSIIQMAPPVAVTALSKGDVDMIDTPSDSVTGYTKGLPFRIVYEAWNKSPWVIIGKTSLNSIPDLKGKVIGIHASGTAPDAYLRAALKSANLTEKDVQLLHLNGTQDIFTAVISGKVDAGVISPPFDAQAGEQGAHVVAFIGDYLQLPYIGLATTVPYLQQHHEAVVGAIRALWRANSWIRSNPDGAAQLISQNIGVTPNIAQQTYKTMVPLLTTTGETSTAGLQQNIQMLEEVSNTKINVNLQDLVDNGPLKEATKP